MRGRSLYILGRGRLGSALARQARSAGYTLTGTWSRGTGKPLPGSIHANLVALAVPEPALANLAGELVPRLPPAAIVFHVSGSIGLEPLQPLAKAGFAVGSLHPYCSLSDALTSLRGASCAIEGAPRARTGLRRLARALGMRPLARPPRDRPRYHLSAGLLIASTLAAATRSEELLLASGLSPQEARRTLAGFLKSVAGNLERLGPRGALSGPLARGERERLAAHFALLTGDEPTLRLYQAAVDVLMAPKETPRSATRGKR